MRSVLLLALIIAMLPAVETDEVEVIRVIDGDSLVVRATVGGVVSAATIRLRWVDTPEMNKPGGEKARAFLLARVQPGERVRLRHPGESFPLDGHGRILALVVDRRRRVLQEELIRAGWSVYWQRYGSAPEPDGQRLRVAMEQAMHGNVGRWARERAVMEAQAAERQRAR